MRRESSTDFSEPTSIARGMESFPPLARFEQAVEAGNALLARWGYAYRTTATELVAWLQTDTPYPNPAPAKLLDTIFLVVHEIVEIAEAERMGLKITKDVIVRNMEKINDAHLIAAEVELRVAVAEGDIRYVETRLADLGSWCEDPLLTASQRAAYESFRNRVRRWLRMARLGRTTEEL